VLTRSTGSNLTTSGQHIVLLEHVTVCFTRWRADSASQLSVYICVSLWSDDGDVRLAVVLSGRSVPRLGLSSSMKWVTKSSMNWQPVRVN